MGKKKKVSADAQYVLSCLGDDVDLFMIDNLFAGKGSNEGFAIRGVGDEEYEKRLFGYTDLQSRIIGACADEYIELRKREEQHDEDAQDLTGLGRIITTSASLADRYADLLSEIRSARTRTEVDVIMEKYNIGEEELPAARLFANMTLVAND